MPRTRMLPAVLTIGVLTALGLGAPEVATAMTPGSSVVVSADEPTASPTPTVAPTTEPTATPSPTATPIATATATATPTATATAAPTATPTAVPTATPSPAPKHFTKEPKPRVSGTHRVGSKLRVAVGSWKPKATRVSVRWRRDGHAVARATHRSYTLKKADRGHRITVVVTAARTGYGSAHRTSRSVLVLKKKIHHTASSSCDPNYSGCVPIASDVDCAGGSGNGPAYVQGPVRVLKTDIYGLDYDHDGIGCE